MEIWPSVEGVGMCEATKREDNHENNSTCEAFAEIEKKIELKGFIYINYA